jgi:myosin-1
MSLKKDDIVELVEKDNNGWWLIRMNGAEGWAPNSYLELVTQTPPPPPAAPPPRKAPAPKVDITPSTASAAAKPVSVFPGMAAGNGSTTPWKKTPSNSEANPANSRPSPPPVAAKPKPAVGAKPSVGKPGIPAAPRLAPSNVKSSVSKATVPGQVDLAAAVSLSSCQLCYFSLLSSRSSRDVLNEWRITTNDPMYIPDLSGTSHGISKEH